MCTAFEYEFIEIFKNILFILFMYLEYISNNISFPVQINR